jgi:hypothetical protein
MAAEKASSATRQETATFLIIDSFDPMGHLLHFTYPVYRIILNIGG